MMANFILSCLACLAFFAAGFTIGILVARKERP